MKYIFEFNKNKTKLNYYAHVLRMLVISTKAEKYNTFGTFI